VPDRKFDRANRLRQLGDFGVLGGAQHCRVRSLLCQTCVH
jgi:hypothetical protein